MGQPGRAKEGNSGQGRIAGRTVYAQVLAWKGTVVARQQAMRRLRKTLQAGDSRQLLELFDGLLAASRELSNQSLVIPKPGTEELATIAPAHFGLDDV
jgi:hypothetical protein